jgi:hypothetical protein
MSGVSIRPIEEGSGASKATGLITLEILFLMSNDSLKKSGKAPQ